MLIGSFKLYVIVIANRSTKLYQRRFLFLSAEGCDLPQMPDISEGRCLIWNDICHDGVSSSIKLSGFLASGRARVKLHKPNVIFAKFHPRSQSEDLIIVVLEIESAKTALRTTTSTSRSTKIIRLNRLQPPDPQCPVKYFLNHLAVWDFWADFKSSLGEPQATTCPPSSPPSGPRSTI